MHNDEKNAIIVMENSKKYVYYLAFRGLHQANIIIILRSLGKWHIKKGSMIKCRFFYSIKIQFKNFLFGLNVKNWNSTNIERQIMMKVIISINF